MKRFPGTKMTLTMLLLIGSGVMVSAAPDRPRDPWVFRCVLDGNPRMVVIALHEHLWLAYDAESCSLRQVWRDGVKFDGAVYTTVHGPQPTSKGEPVFIGPNDDVWTVMELDGRGNPPRGVTSVSPIWKGYAIRDDQVTLRYKLPLPIGGYATVEETPELVVEDDGSMILARRFAADFPDNDVSVHMLAQRYIGDVENSNMELVSLSMVNAILPSSDGDGTVIETTVQLKSGEGIVRHRLRDAFAEKRISEMAP